MIGLALLLVQAATAPVPAAAQPASPRALAGRFTCGAHSYEVAVSAEPAMGTPVRLDRLAIDGKPVDAGSLAEGQRTVGRLADIASLDVRCLGEAGELSLYGSQVSADGTVRRARIRASLARGRASGFVASVAQATR